MTGIDLFVFGLGYSARALARLVLAGGGRVAGTSRAPEPRTIDGSTVQSFDGRAPIEQSAAFRRATHLLCSIPPDADGDPALRLHREAIAMLPQLIWIGYLSTTGVYGDRAGGWVDETTEPAPTQPRSRHRLLAERQWLELGRRAGIATHIFRLPGIYGPGRSALDQVRAGSARRIEKPGHYFSRIHVEDIAATLLASMRQPRADAVYNVADDEPAAPADVIAYACELLDRKAPEPVRFEEAVSGMSEMARSFWSESRRVRNERIKRELHVALRYPSYREGLRGILAAGG